jgi:hypothetical protein
VTVENEEEMEEEEINDDVINEVSTEGEECSMLNISTNNLSRL